MLCFSIQGYSYVCLVIQVVCYASFVSNIIGYLKMCSLCLNSKCEMPIFESCHTFLYKIIFSFNMCLDYTKIQIKW